MSIVKFENAPCVYVYEDAFSSELFVSMVEKESKDSWPYLSWVSSGTGYGDSSAISEYRSSLEMNIMPLHNDTVVERLKPIQDEYRENVFLPIQDCVHDYKASNDLFIEKDTGWSLLKYTNGGQYHIHHDHGPDNSRVASLVACLGDEFEGGELEFNRFNLKIKLKRNSLIMFPSNFPYTHIAHPVSSGTKYSLVSWFV
jgi:hypothetical protein